MAFSVDTQHSESRGDKKKNKIAFALIGLVLEGEMLVSHEGREGVGKGMEGGERKSQKAKKKRH